MPASGYYLTYLYDTKELCCATKKDYLKINDA